MTRYLLSVFQVSQLRTTHIKVTSVLTRADLGQLIETVGLGADAPDGGGAGASLQPHGAQLSLCSPHHSGARTGGRGLDLAALEVLVQSSQL